MQQKRNMISQILFKEWDKLILSFPDNRKEKWKVIINKFRQMRILVFTWFYDYKTYDLNSIINNIDIKIEKYDNNYSIKK